MKTYSLITKPYRIRLKPHMKHTLINPLTNKGIAFEGGAEFWCAKAYSQDHTTYKSLFIYNHSTFTTFKLGSTAMSNKWDIIESNICWRSEMSVLQASCLNLNMFTDGTVPQYVPKDETN